MVDRGQRPRTARAPDSPARPVSEVMSREVVAVQSGTRLDAAARLLREFHISGVPVIDASERVLGVLSERDIVRVLRASTGLPTPRGLLDLLLGSTPQRGPGLRELALGRLRSGRVQQAMTAPARTIAPTS